MYLTPKRDWHSAYYQNQKPTLIKAANLCGIQHDRDTVYTGSLILHILQILHDYMIQVNPISAFFRGAHAVTEVSPHKSWIWPRTCNLALEAADQLYVPTNKSWRLNERMYGGLTGLDKKEWFDPGPRCQVITWVEGFSPPFGNHKRRRELDLFSYFILIPSDTYLDSAPVPSLCAIEQPKSYIMPSICMAGDRGEARRGAGSDLAPQFWHSTTCIGKGSLPCRSQA